MDNKNNAAGVPDLHNAIMNLPCKPGRAIVMNEASKQAYKEGHRDARHAAAELVNEALAAAPADQQGQERPNADCSGTPSNCPDNEGYGCACGYGAPASAKPVAPAEPDGGAQ